MVNRPLRDLSPAQRTLLRQQDLAASRVGIMVISSTFVKKVLYIIRKGLEMIIEKRELSELMLINFGNADFISWGKLIHEVKGKLISMMTHPIDIRNQ